MAGLPPTPLSSSGTYYMALRPSKRGAHGLPMSYPHFFIFGDPTGIARELLPAVLRGPCGTKDHTGLPLCTLCVLVHGAISLTPVPILEHRHSSLDPDVASN